MYGNVQLSTFAQSEQNDASTLSLQVNEDDVAMQRQEKTCQREEKLLLVFNDGDNVPL